MHKTGAHLELSMAKDQGLSIMVSGKLDAVMKARKEIVSRLQTQVSVAGVPTADSGLCRWDEFLFGCCIHYNNIGCIVYIRDAFRLIFVISQLLYY